METQIAKTKKGLIAAYIVILVLGAIFFIFGVAALLFGPTSSRIMAIYFIPLGVVFMGLGIGFTVYFARLPKICITFGEGKMRLHNGLEFSPAEIDYCTSSKWGLDSLMYNYGTLILSVRHQEYKYRFVIDVSAVANRINALKTQFTAIEEVQKHIAEKKAAENTENIDKTVENTTETTPDVENQG